MGVALGGGHGTLQGHYGLLADQIVAARVVLANGKVVTVSKKKNSDLFWALRGAGHNFGIVTEVTYKVYDAPAEDNWLVKTFIYLPDQIGAFYEIANKAIANGYGVNRQPAGMLVASLYTVVPDVDPNTVCETVSFFTGRLALARKPHEQYLIIIIADRAPIASTTLSHGVRWLRERDGTTRQTLSRPQASFQQHPGDLLR